MTGSPTEAEREIDYVKVNLFNEGNKVEQLALAPGEPFDAELIADKWTIEVEGIEWK